MKTEPITTEAELDARLETLQARKQRRHARQAKLEHYGDIAIITIIVLLVAGYVGWPWLSAGRSDEVIGALLAVRNFFVVVIVARAFDYAVDRIKAYRRSLHS